MSEQENVALIKSGYAAFTRGDLQALLGLFSEDLDFQHPMPQSIWPWAGKRKGRAGFAEFLAGLKETIELEQFEPREFIAQGDYVAVLVFETRTSQSNRRHFRQLVCPRFQAQRRQDRAVPDF